MKHRYRYVNTAISLIVISTIFLGIIISGRMESDPHIAVQPDQTQTNTFKLKKLPKHDRMDLAMQDEFEKTKDPALGYVPRQRLSKAYEYADELRRQIYSPSGRLLKTNSANGVADITWTPHGPNNVGGRSRAVMFDPNDTNTKKVWAGAVSGGLWYTNDVTASTPTWVKVDDFWDNIAVTCIAYDPTDTDIFYVGTGEGWTNIDAVRGAGIWKTADGGVTWNQLSSTDNSTFYYVQKVVVHPSTGDVYAGTYNGGVQKSTDGGGSWTKVLGIGDFASSNRVADLEIGADNRIYASLGIFDTDGVYTSTSGNRGFWLKRINGFSTSDFQRIELAASPSDANTVYALVQGSGSTIEGLYKTTDQGVNWSAITTPVNVHQSNSFAKGQAWYNLIAAVHPTDPATVYIGGIDLFKTTDSGTNWTQISQWYGGYSKPYVHADQHAILFRPGSPLELVIGNDGGIWYTDDAGATFSDQSSGYITAQYYSCTVHPTSNNYYFLGGTQDNGTHKFNQSGIDDIDEVIGGDGGFCFISSVDPDIQIGSYVNNNWYLSTNGGASFSSVHSDGTGRFINPADYDDDNDILYASMASETDVKRLRNFSGSITEDNITGLSLTGTVTAVRVSPHTANLLFVGTYSGHLYTFSNAHATPTVTDISDAGFTGAWRYISCIEIGATDDQILITFSNYGLTSVWETTDGGSTWNNKEGNLPDMPVRWALYNPADRSEVILATEVGVWSTTDITATTPTWNPSNSGLANVRVDMLKLRSSDNFVIAGTHGRGMYSTDGFTTPRAMFHADETVTWAGDNVQFTDDSYRPTSWSWNFGDGNTSTLQNPSHSYNVGGKYTVSLEINGGASTEAMTNYIHALGKKGTPYIPEDGGNFEVLTDDYGSTALSGGINLWEKGSPSNVINNTASGANVWKTDLDANVPPSSTYSCALLTPKYDFTTSGTYYIKFKFRMDVVFPNAPGEVYLEYSTDGGSNWSRLGGLQGTDANAVQNWYNTDETNNVGSNSFTGACWWLDRTSYVQAIYDASALQGNSDVRFRFVYRNEGNWSASEFDGFAVDDFEIEGPRNSNGYPTVSTTAISSITKTTASSGGNVTDQGSSSVTERGIVWGLNTYPTVDSYTGKVIDPGSGTGSFNSSITGLSEGMVYYGRAYATNSSGTYYGNIDGFLSDMDNPGNVLDFDGTNDYVDVTSTSNIPIGNTAYTIEVWVKPDATGYLGIVGWGSWLNNQATMLQFWDGGIYHRWGNYDIFTNTSYGGGNWIHIATTYNGTSRTIYANGQFIKSDTPGIAHGVTHSDNFYIGDALSASGSLNGQLDELRIWNVARSLPEIQNNMYKRLSGSESNLVAYYSFDSVDGTILKDLTSNDNDGTLLNMDTPTDWVESTAPVGEQGKLVNTVAQTTTGEAGKQMQVTITSTPTTSNYLGIYSYGDGTGPVEGEDFGTTGATRRADVVWGIEEYGSVTSILVFDYSSLNGISNPSEMQLLKRTDASSAWTDVTTDFTHDTNNRTFTKTGVTGYSEYSVGTNSPDNSLPVTLNSFAAQIQLDKIIMNWTTESEVENKEFVLEKSEDGKSFFPISKIPGHGNSSIGHEYEFVDEFVRMGNTYHYALSNIDYNGTINRYDTLTVDFTESAIAGLVPMKFALHPNFPNPFNPNTNIRFDLPSVRSVYLVDISVYNLLGQKVRQLLKTELEPGRYTEAWDGRNDAGKAMTSGTYYLLIRAGEYAATKKMLLMK